MKGVDHFELQLKFQATVPNKTLNTGWPKKMRTHILFDKKPIF